MTYTIRHTDTVAALLLLALSAAVFLISADYPTGPSGDPGTAFFPRLIAAAIAALAVVQIINSSRSAETTETGITAPVAKRVTVAFAFPVAYLLLLPILGFVVVTFLFLATFMYYSGARSTAVVIGGSAGVALALHYIFASFFHVSLPEGIVPIARLLPRLPFVLGGFA